MTYYVVRYIGEYGVHQEELVIGVRSGGHPDEDRRDTDNLGEYEDLEEAVRSAVVLVRLENAVPGMKLKEYVGAKFPELKCW